MKQLINEEFLLEKDTASKLYYEHAEKMGFQKFPVLYKT
jgi:hypothetical protein